MDKRGNIVAGQRRLTMYSAPGIVPEGYGFIMNDEMDDFDAEVGTANRSTTGQRDR